MLEYLRGANLDRPRCRPRERLLTVELDLTRTRHTLRLEQRGRPLLGGELLGRGAVGAPVQQVEDDALAQPALPYLQRLPEQLSGGERQRVALARALFRKPQLLLADEPTGSLDPQTGAGVISLLRELNERDGLTLVVVTHEVRVSSAAGRVVRLRDGLLERDPPSDQVVNG